MHLSFESGAGIKDPGVTDLRAIEGEEFAILAREENCYMQCAETGDPNSPYVLEYQEGSLDAHFEAVDAPITLERVVGAFSKYILDDATWRNDFTWEKMEL